jgi:hypothetical protein
VGNGTPEKDRDGNNQRYFDLPAFVDTSAWRLDLSMWAAVSLCCLDLAIFNDDGRMMASATMATSDLLLPGWRVKSDKVRDRLRNAGADPPSEYRLLSIGRLSNCEPSFADSVLAFKYKRVGRLRPPWAVAAYAAFTAYHTRAAFEHDFAKGLGGAQDTGDDGQT